MAVPNIRISDAAAPSVHSLRSAVYEEHAMENFVRPELPSPVPSYSPNRSVAPSPSPIVPNATLSPPVYDARPPSCVSSASSDTLDGRETPQSLSPPCDTYFDGPLTADPESIIAEPDASGDNTVATPVTRREMLISPTPIRYFTEGSQSRYRRKVLRPQDAITTIPPFNDFAFREKPGGRWESFVHPEGNRYFRYMNFFTDEDLYDSSNDYRTLYYIDRAVARLQRELDEMQCSNHVENSSLDLDHVEIGIKLTMDYEDEDTGGKVVLCCYYYVNTASKEVFYADEVSDYTFFDGGVTKIISREHFRKYFCAMSPYPADQIRTDILAEAAYWSHVFMFPHRRRISPVILYEVQAELLWSQYDRQTSNASTAVYTVDELHKFHAIIKDTATDGEHDTLPSYVTLVARMKDSLLKAAFVRYRGEYCAQLNAYEGQHGHWPEPTTYFKTIGYLCFGTPQIYLARLRRVWIDGLLNQKDWRKLIGELQDDWAASITPVTVILTTNIGFLAIQSVDQGGTAYPDRTVAQILCYLSTLLSIGNIIACTVLVRQHRLNAFTNAYGVDALCYLQTRAFTNGGMEMLAIIYAIPMACFLWALLTFALAIGWVCFYNTSAVTRSIVGLTAVLVLLMLGAVVYNGDWNIQAQAVAALKQRVDRTKVLVKNAKRAPRQLSTKVRKFSLDATTALKRKTKTLSGSKPAESARDPPMTTTRAPVTDSTFARVRHSRRYSSWKSRETTLLPT